MMFLVGLIIYIIIGGITNAILQKANVHDIADDFPALTLGSILWPITILVWIGIWSKMLTSFLINNIKIQK